MSRATNRVIAVLCGLPGSGKTQLVTHYKQSKPTYNILHINYDKIIPRDSNLKEEEWKSRRKWILNSLEAYLRGSDEDEIPIWLKKETLSLQDDAPLVIFIDDNNFLSSMRYEYYQLSRSLQIGFCQVEMKASLDISIYRNENLRVEEEQISSDVIQRMHSKFESPNPLKNYWEVYSFMIDSSTREESVDNNFEMIETILNTALNNPVTDVITINKAKADESRLVCNASVIHQADNILRKKINSLIKGVKESSNLSKEEAQIRIQGLLEAKSDLLEDLRTGFTKIPSDIVKNIRFKERRDSILPKLSDELEQLLQAKLCK